jgi:L-galactose dehydrogenase/L-glyceraldehyde 3-phosphate reductase
VLGFGCGNVGGLMVRGTAAERERAVGRALELGLNYFDTAPSYGDGLSEQHLGEALRSLRADAFVGTKVRLDAPHLDDVQGRITRSLDASLRRLGLERVDLFQLHNPIGLERRDGTLAARDLGETVWPAFEALRQAGKARCLGITALGDTEALHQVVDGGRLDTAQVCLNLLTPSAALAVPARFPAQDFGRLLDAARARQVGAIVIRVLAAGALSGVPDRHPIAAPSVDPIGSGPDYAVDVGHARALSALVDEGYAASLVEAAFRFAISWDAVATVLVGASSLEQLETAAQAVARGPLSPAAIERLGALWRRLAASSDDRMPGSR